MEKLTKFLEELGFGRNEILVYMALITMKEATVLEISKKINSHRSNIYEALDSLVKRGLVFNFEDPVKKYYAKNPKSLMEFLKNKQLELEDILKNIERQINVPKENRIGKTKGKTALIESISDLLKLNKTIYVYGMKKNTHEVLGPAMKIFEKERIKKKIEEKIIYDSDSNKIMKIMDKKEFLEVKSLPPKYNSDITTWVCKDTVLIVNWESDISITRIEDEEIARSYSQYFNLLWNGAKCEVCTI
jgi:sugar-specific transcriptional regulator TrmB